MACEAYHRGRLEDYKYLTEAVDEAMAHLPKVPAMSPSLDAKSKKTSGGVLLPVQIITAPSLLDHQGRLRC